MHGWSRWNPLFVDNGVNIFKYFLSFLLPRWPSCTDQDIQWWHKGKGRWSCQPTVFCSRWTSNYFQLEKDQKSLESFIEKEKPHRSSLLVVTVKDQTSFGEYICHIQDRFKSTTHTISIQKLKDTGNTAFDLFILHKFYQSKPNHNTIISALNGQKKCMINV